MANTLTKLRVNEIAIVDEPAVQKARFLVYKRADGAPGETEDESEEVKKSKARELLDGVVKTLKRIGEYIGDSETRTIVEHEKATTEVDMDEDRFKVLEAKVDELHTIFKAHKEADEVKKEEVKEDEAKKEEKTEEENPLQKAVDELKAQNDVFVEGFRKLNARLDNAVSKSSVATKDEEKKAGQSIFAGRLT